MDGEPSAGLNVKKFIAVAGNIGVGKSTLVSLLSERLGWKPFYEPVAENPYLPDFYQDMRSWSFHSQVFFLTHRLLIHKQVIDYPDSAIQDRSVYEDAEVFARNLYHQGHMHERDYKTYRELYRVLTKFLPPPDLVIYLRASDATLLDRIHTRDRDYERDIKTVYLQRLNQFYEQWINEFNLCPVLTVPADDLDYVHHEGHLDLMVEKVQQKLTGKDVVEFGLDEVKKGRG